MKRMHNIYDCILTQKHTNTTYTRNTQPLVYIKKYEKENVRIFKY